MFYRFYALPIWRMILLTLIAVLLWGLVGRWCTEGCGFGVSEKCSCRCKLWVYINCGLFLIWTAFIVYTTLIDRSPHERELILNPFHFIIDARVTLEIYRSMLANVILFVPFGAVAANGIVPVIYKAGKKDVSVSRVILTTALIGLGLSLCVESLQYVIALGRAEVDDLIMNSLGAGIGALSYWIAIRHNK